MIVESMFSMNSATAMMRGTSRSRLMRGLGRAGAPLLAQGARRIIAERAGVPRYSSAPAREGSDDLHPGLLPAAARSPVQRPAVLGGIQPAADRFLPDLRVDLPGAVSRSLDPWRRCGGDG